MPRNEDALKSKTHKVWIAFDFDGVIASYDGWKGFDVLGQPIPQTIIAMQALKARGCKITILTTRPATPVMLDWLKKYDVPYDSINSNAHNPPCTSQKPIYHCFVDDRAVNYHGQSSVDLMEQISKVVEG